MNEYFLHYIWQYQYFNKQELKNNQGESITVLHPGYRNTDQGPDFAHARLLMQDIEWHGHVEIHLKSSDWFLHKHQHDKNYDTVILHIVWENDCQIRHNDDSILPVLELKNRVDLAFLDKYRIFINSGVQLPCQYYLNELDPIHIVGMFDKVMVERLERKGREILQKQLMNKNNWEETFWQILVTSFGFKINNAAFAQLSKVSPYKLLLKHSDNLMQLEALLFGQAGLLEGAPKDIYMANLQKEYNFLAHKYSLKESKMSNHVWKFLRTRPYNFPTIRIAQLASLVQNCHQLINLIYDKRELNEYVKLLRTSVSSYWKQHYRFGEIMKGEVPGITENTVYSIIINVVIPFKVARAIESSNDIYLMEVISLLESMPSEQNKLSRDWKKIGIKMKNAYDSQAGIELYNQYCLKRKCLYCTIGSHIIKS